MRKVDFHVYIRAGEDEPTIYAGREFVEEEPRKVMGLIKEKAEKMARTYEDVSPDLSITRFYKVRFQNDHLQCTSLMHHS